MDLGEGLEKIEDAAFSHCISLRENTIPPAVKEIGEWALGHCPELTTVDLGEGLEEIGERACIECSSLRDIIVPNAVSKIKDDTYSQCCNLTNVHWRGAAVYWGGGI